MATIKIGDNLDIEQEVFLEKIGLGGFRGEIMNPLVPLTQAEEENPALFLIRKMRNPEYFYFTVKHLFGIELFPYQCMILQELWRRPRPMFLASRGASKSFILGIYSLLRSTLIQGRKVVLTGAGFRQAKAIFSYAENCFLKSPILQSICAENSVSGITHGNDRWILRIGDSTTVALPMGDGNTIRGERAHDTVADEYHSMNEEVFESVVGGFSVVNIDPGKQVERAARIRLMKKKGLWTPEMDEEDRLAGMPNQTILSGTAYYQFNHFYAKWKKYKAIIESGGDPKIIQDIHGYGKKVHPGFDYRNYSVIRLPVELLPEGYMSDEVVAGLRMELHEAAYLNELSTCWASDSNGFFKMSLLESCTTRQPIQTASGESVQFHAMVSGIEGREYIYGIDPAIDDDNFALVILEVHGDHRRVVHCWTTNKNDHRERVETGTVKEKDYYRYCMRKIRDLMKIFPCKLIAMDGQGGGAGIREALGDTQGLQAGEEPIYRLHYRHPLFRAKGKNTKDHPDHAKPGLHILEICQMADVEYCSESNHGMRKDLENPKSLLFPYLDAAQLAIVCAEDNAMGRTKDTLEDCYDEIEKLKKEMATIEIRPTPNGREHFDTPETKTPGMPKGRMRKDRYSALLMANFAARRLSRTDPKPNMSVEGGGVGEISKVTEGTMYGGPTWYGSAMDECLAYLG